MIQLNTKHINSYVGSTGIFWLNLAEFTTYRGRAPPAPRNYTLRSILIGAPRADECCHVGVVGLECVCVEEGAVVFFVGGDVAV